MSKVGIVVTARVASRRLPGKILQKIRTSAGLKTALEILLDRLHNTRGEYQIVVAITSRIEDDAIKDIVDLDYPGVKVYRGQDDSPLHRLCEVAKQYGFTDVVRVTADDILIDPEILSKHIEFHVRGENDYTWISRMPEGTAAEVISARALKDAVNKCGSENVEHVSYYIKRPEYRIKEFYAPFDYHYSYRCTIDYPQDLTLVRVLFELIPHPFYTLQIIECLRRNPHLRDINALPAVTVYTCTYNHAKYLKDCMDSVAAQSFKDWEFLIIDDGSEDDTPRVVADWLASQPEPVRSRCQYIRHQNIGLAASSNKAVMLARGKYVVRVDSDDIIDPGFLDLTTHEISRQNVSALFPAFRRIDQHGHVVDSEPSGEYHPGGCLMETRAVRDVLYREKLNHFEGLEFFSRFKQMYRWGRLERECWSYRISPESKTSSKSKERAKIKQEFRNV